MRAWTACTDENVIVLVTSRPVRKVRQPQTHQSSTSHSKYLSWSWSVVRWSHHTPSWKCHPHRGN